MKKIFVFSEGESLTLKYIAILLQHRNYCEYFLKRDIIPFNGLRALIMKTATC